MSLLSNSLFLRSIVIGILEQISHKLNILFSVSTSKVGISISNPFSINSDKLSLILIWRLSNWSVVGGNPISIIISALHKGYSLSVTTSIVLYKFTHFTKTSCSAFEISLCSIISTSDITWPSSPRLLLTQNVFLCFIASAISNKYLGSKTLNADSSVGKYIIPVSYTHLTLPTSDLV